MKRARDSRGRRGFRALALVVYGAMVLAALGIAWARGASVLSTTPTEPALDSSIASVGLGVVLAALTIGSTRWIVLGTRWGRTLRDDFRALLADATPSDAVWLAVSSGVGEELLFRGALVPWWGWLASSLAFGVLHVGPSRRFLGWTLWASSLGALLALIFETTGRIEGCVVAHVLINAVNLRFVLAFEGRLDTPRAPPGEQALVSRRVRRDTR